jgi:MFS family permease
MVLSFTRSLIEEHNIQVERDSLILLGMIGGGLLLSMLVSGYLSDRMKARRPFIVVGLVCFGALASTLILNADNIPGLYSIWPAVLLLSLGAGAFPPAILAYLSDISRRETRGITFGVYSLIFGTGMIIGPILGGASLQYYGNPGFIALMFAFVAVSCLSTLFMRERLKG